MADYPQIHRLIRILQILSSGRKITTNDLFQRFDGRVSRRTLQRDLLTLSEAEIPLISEKTKSNENAWSLMSHFRSFVAVPLGTNEYLAAHILKSNLRIFEGTPFEKEIKSLIDKIDQIVPEDVFLEVKQAGAENLFENYSAGMFDYSPYGAIIDGLISTILNKTKCLVTYFNPIEAKDKTFYIEPEKMVYYGGALYAIVFVPRFKQYVLLAVQRIRNLRPSDEQFPKNHVFNENDFWSGRFGLFAAEKVEIMLRFSKEIRHHIEGRQWHPSQTMKNDKHGNLILEMNVGISPELVTWIMGWHMFVEVLQPQELIDEIKENLNRMKTLYENDES